MCGGRVSGRSVLVAQYDDDDGDDYHYYQGCPRGVMVKAMDCGIVLSEFVFQSRYYVHFQAITLGKGMKPSYPPSYGLNSTTTVLLGEKLWH